MISLICAHDELNVIGFNGDMPWGRQLKKDLKWFQDKTEYHIVLMGRTTYESIGKPLPNRINVILTSDTSAQYEGAYTVSSIGEFMSDYTFTNEQFIVGGSTLYEQFLPYADRLYITHVKGEYNADTYFPQYDLSNYTTIHEEDVIDNGVQLTFAIYEKKNKK